jgi:hypothetical protein
MSTSEQPVQTTVRVHIDRRPYEVPSPTTGSHLYDIATIGPHRELFKAVTGDHEDDMIARDNHHIVLHEDDHFYSEKEFDIVVRARPRKVTSTNLTFDEVVSLAYDQVPVGPNIVFTVSYRHGPKANQKGTMISGSVVKIKEGMVFDVSFTDRS